MSEAEKALLTLQERLELIYSLCCGTAPKQSVGELIAVMRKMPEWQTVREQLEAQRAAPAPSGAQDADMRINAAEYAESLENVAKMNAMTVPETECEQLRAAARFLRKLASAPAAPSERQPSIELDQHFSELLEQYLDAAEEASSRGRPTFLQKAAEARKALTGYVDGLLNRA